MIDLQQLRQGVIASSHPDSSSTYRKPGGSFFTIPQCPFSIPIGPLAAEFDGFALVNHIVQDCYQHYSRSLYTGSGDSKECEKDIAGHAIG